MTLWIQRQTATVSTEPAEPRYTLTIRGQVHEALTRDQSIALLERHSRWISDMIDVGVETHNFLKRNREDHSVVGWIADTLGGVECPSMSIWVVPRTALRQADTALETGRVDEASRALDLAEVNYRRCDQMVYAYREGTISGAEIGEGIAVGTAVVCAVVFVAAGGALAAGAGAGAAGAGAGAAGAGAGGVGVGGAVSAGGSGAATTAAAETGAAVATATAATETGAALTGATAGVEAATGAAQAGVAGAASAGAAGTAGLALDVVAAASGSAVTAEGALASGAITTTSKLYPVLQAIQSGFQSAAPQSGAAALAVIQAATRSLGLDTGYAALGPGGTIILSNARDTITYVFANGQVLIIRASQVVLNLLP